MHQRLTTEAQRHRGLVSITANEGQAGDIAGADLGTDDRSFSVRASRTGQQKQGRVYTVRYSATDASGNTAFANARSRVGMTGVTGQ